MRCESDRTPPVPLIECVKTPTGAAQVSTEPDQRRS